MKSESSTVVHTFRLSREGLSPTDLSGDTLDEVSNQLPDGAYTTLRTLGGDRFLHLGAHLDRLVDSASILGRSMKLDVGRLRQALADVLTQMDFPESRVRITTPLNNGESTQAYISVEPFEGVDPEFYETGVRTITMLIARATPRAKATGFIRPSRKLKAGLPHEVYEVLMVTGDGQILEGFTSNFFAFIDGKLLTAGEGVLEGITRAIILDLAETLFPVEQRAPRVTEIPRFEEAFITSSSRGVLPVVVINEEVIGDGRPGRLTQRLSQRYDEYIRQTARPPV